jgi:shiga toxin subunit A
MIKTLKVCYFDSFTIKNFFKHSIIIAINIFILMLLLTSPIVLASGKSFTINFETKETYLASLRIIREELGTPLQNIQPIHIPATNYRPERNVYIRGLPSYGGTEGHILHLTNIFDESAPISLVMSPTNLYIAGFIEGNTYYRFSDTSDITLPSLYRVVQLHTRSDYTSLHAIAGTNRISLGTNRSNLDQSIRDLSNIASERSPRQLTRAQARGILRLITITAEALRFRPIQQGFVVTFFNNVDFLLTNLMLQYTLNWGSISRFSYNMISGSETLDNVKIIGRDGLIKVLAIALNCAINSSSRPKRSINNNETCSLENRKIEVINVGTGESITSYGSNGDDVYGYPGYSYRDYPKNKSWEIQYTNDGNIRLKSLNNSCLRNAYDDVVEYDCDSFPGNNWKKLHSENGFVQLKNILQNKCLSAAEHASGFSKLNLVPCVKKDIPAKQLWFMKPASEKEDKMKDISIAIKKENIFNGSERDVAIINAYTGDFITSSDIYNGYLYGYSRYYSRHAPKYKAWKMTYNKNGDVRFKSIIDRCIRNSYDDIIQNTCDNFLGNDWEPIYSENGFVQLKNLQRNKCLVIVEGRKYSDLALQDCDKNIVSARQLWSIADYSDHPSNTTIVGEM